MNDSWIDLFIFFLVADKAETVIDLIKSDNYEEAFTDIMQRIVNIDLKRFHHSCVEWLMNHKDKLLELNKAYKESMKCNSTVEKSED